MTRRGLVGAFQGDQVRIDRSTFNEVHGHLNHYHIKGDLHNHENEHGLYALSNVISAGALHDAIERCPPPKCHPETRKEVRRIIMSWIEDPDSLADIIWIHGPAGVGKSAIAQSIAEWCRSSNKHLAASFFFLRGKPGRDEGRYLFPTIAYQLALHVPGLREHVNRAMSADATLPSKDLETQLRKLIIEPLQKLSPPPQHPPCVIIDGIDECQIYETQKRILTLIADVLVTSKISLRFLIASRPEAHIRETFETSVLAQRTRRIVLDGTFQPDRDIRTYLIDGFVEIEERNQELMAHLPKPWPPKNIIDELVAKSSGQFIYAATVLKFVGADLHIPNTQLETVLQSPPARSTLFSNLDKLYSQILLTCPYRETLVRIFAIMLVLHCPQPPEVYDDILGVDGGHVRHTLRGMHSLIKFPNDFEDEEERTLFNQRQEYDQTCGLRFHHASFGDFLVDRSRSGQFFVDLIEAHTQLTKCGFQLLTDCIACPWRGLKGSHAPCPETWGYLKNHLHIHLSKCRESDRQSVIQALEEFKEDLLESMPAEDNSWNVAFPALHSLVTTLANTVTDDGDTLSGKFLHSEHSHWTQEVTFQSVLLLNRNAVKDQEVLELCLKYCKTLDDFYTFFFSKSDDMVRLLAYFPGFAVWKDRIPVDWLEDIFGAGRDVILADIQKNVRFIYRWESLFWIPFSPVPRSALDVVSLNAHISGFLSDRGRSGVYYQDPEVKQIGACRDLIKTIFRPGWLQAEKQAGALSCMDEMLKLYLDTAHVDSFRDYPDDHPMIGLIEDLGLIVYDIPCLEGAPLPNVRLLWSATRRILNWIQRQQPKTTGSRTQARNLNKMFTITNNRIYRQILRIESFGKNGEIVTLCEPFLVAASPRRFRMGSEPSNSSNALVCELDHSGHKNTRRVSETLLALHGVRFSLSEFLTRRDCAGPLYIPAQVYHTQFAEICLDRCDPLLSDMTGDWRILPSYAQWRFHLVRALPSPELLAKLRNIGAGPWLAEGLPTGDTEAKIKSVKDIIRWLEKLSQTPPDIHERWQEVLKLIGRTDRHRTMPKKHDLRLRGEIRSA